MVELEPMVYVVGNECTPPIIGVHASPPVFLFGATIRSSRPRCLVCGDPHPVSVSLFVPIGGLFPALSSRSAILAWQPSGQHAPPHGSARSFFSLHLMGLYQFLFFGTSYMNLLIDNVGTS